MRRPIDITIFILPYLRTCAILKLYLLTLVLTVIANNSRAQEWKLKKESDGIKIYSKTLPNSCIKALKASFVSAGTTAKMESILLDVEGMKDWVYSTKSSTIIKRISKHELIYYSEKEAPWPVSNRDIVVRIKVNRDSASGIMTINLSPLRDHVAIKKNIVRITLSNVTWKITPISNDSVSIVYTAETDPGGNIPAWVINLFSTKGALETFKKLKLLLEKKQ